MGLFGRLAEAWRRGRAESASKRREAAAQLTAVQEELEQVYEQGVRRRVRERILNPPTDTWVPADTVQRLFGSLLDQPVGMDDQRAALKKLTAAAKRELINGQKPKQLNDDLIAAGVPEDKAPDLVKLIVDGYNILRRHGLTDKDIRQQAENDLLPESNDVVLTDVGAVRIKSLLSRSFAS
jgi:hypothetical protein